MQLVTVTDLRKNLRDIIDEMMRGEEPVAVMRGAKPVAVLMGFADYERLVKAENEPQTSR